MPGVAVRHSLSVHVAQLLIATGLDLDGRVDDAEPVAHRLLDPVQHLVARLRVRAVQAHVPAEGRQTGRDAPDVQVVNLDYTRDRGDRAADSVEVDPGRGGFEKDVHRLAHELQRPRRNPYGDQTAHDRVE